MYIIPNRQKWLSQWDSYKINTDDFCEEFQKDIEIDIYRVVTNNIIPSFRDREAF